MVGPYDKPEKADSHYCSDHAHVAERFFFSSVIGDDVGDHSKAGQDEDVHLWVSEESEEVLVKNGVSSPCRVKESCVQVTVGEEHCNAGSKDGQG